MTIERLLTTFANNLLPILLISGSAFLVGKCIPIDARSLGRVLFYLGTPILVFNLLYNTDMEPEAMFRMMGFTGASVLVVGLVTLGAGLALRLERAALTAVLITSMFANAGNYGLPLVAFAFGEESAAHAGVYFVTSIVLFNSVGVVLASLGKVHITQALLAPFKVPSVYAGLLGLALNLGKVPLPVPVARTVDLAAGGTIPMMLILLGLELTRVEWSHSIKAVSLGVAMRLLLAPLVGLLLAPLMGLQPAARQASVVESGMPAAVINTVLAAEYDVEPSLVTSIVFVSTLLSPLTLTPLLVFLGSR
jgi:predicted permease